jgi:hypothetical protein
MTSVGLSDGCTQWSAIAYFSTDVAGRHRTLTQLVQWLALGRLMHAQKVCISSQQQYYLGRLFIPPWSGILRVLECTEDIEVL